MCVLNALFVACVAGAGVGEVPGKSGKRKGGGGEEVPAIRAPVGSILRSLAAATF